MAIKKPAKKTATPDMPPKSSVARITVRSVNVPGYTNRVNADMYGAMRRALVKVLPSRAPGLTQAEMFRTVIFHLPKGLYPGGAKTNWWAKTVQLDLEARGVLAREHTKPLRWHRTGRR